MNCNLTKYVLSPLGKKYFMALTGLFLSGFLVAHLSGNLLLYAGQDVFDAYAEKMQSLGPLLWIARLGLLGLTLIHLFLAFKLSAENRAARPQKYVFEKTVQASLASRYMLVSGLLMLAFICFHIAHYTLRITNPEIDALSSKYQMVVTAFQNPIVAGFYVLSMLALGFHTYHGVSSLWQSLGINHPNLSPVLRKLGPLFGVVIGFGFASIPVSVLVGIIH